MVIKSGGHNAREAEQLLRHPDFFCTAIGPAHEVSFRDQHRFAFPSPLSSRWPSNNAVHGQLFRAGTDWRNRPAVILLHGWNSELGYQTEFPILAWRFNRHGVNAAMMELPFHGKRRPREAGAINDFLSHDLLAMLEATRQSLADTRALALWLLEQGCPSVGVWGISLGAWLAGLLICSGTQIQFAALMTPIPNIEHAIQQLDFCAPIREALKNDSVDVAPLNLASLRPNIVAQNILLIEGLYDLFAPAEVVEHLWRSWAGANIWRVRHGHISVLISVPVMERTVKWFAAQATNVRTPTANLHTRDLQRDSASLRAS